MRLKSFVVSLMETNSYIVCNEDTNNGIIIDPGAEAERIIDFIKTEKINICAVVLTHAHFDHIGAASEIKEFTNAPVCICEKEEIIAENSKYNLSANYGVPLEFKADEILKDGNNYTFKDLTFNIIHTPGHTPGSCCIYFENEGVLFSGDTLFYQNVGRTDFYFGSMEDMLNSLNKLMKLDDNVIVYTGHGPKTSIGFERKHNPYLSAEGWL